MASSSAYQPGSDSASFAEDPNISFDKETGKWRYETEDGNELEFDVLAQAWVPIVDDELLKAQQAAYSIPGVDEEAVAAPVAARAKKRKEVDYTSNTDPAAVPPPANKRGKKNGKGEHTSNDTNGAASSSSSMQSSKPPPPSKNTAVFVSGLPPDTTAEELASRFGKFGVLMEDDEGSPKIKLYADDNGSFSGEALVVYFMEDSVDLAIRMLDEAELRLGESGTVMRVKQGEFGHKSGGGTDAARPTVRRVVDKKKATARINKMKNKLADWDSSDEDDAAIKAPVSKSRAVLLKHMFTLEELEKDLALLLELKDDVREECETLGEVTSVVLYDLEPEGIMTVKFKDPVSAQACVLRMNGRFFDGRQVVATLFDGKGSRYKRSDRGGAANLVNDDDDDEEAGEGDEKKRLDAFAAWLEQDGSAKPSARGS